jgi:hypothetical protein
MDHAHASSQQEPDAAEEKEGQEATWLEQEVRECGCQYLYFCTNKASKLRSSEEEAGGNAA